MLHKRKLYFSASETPLIKSLTQGLTDIEIMRSFGISYGSLYLRMCRLKRKFNVTTREKLVVTLMRKEFEETVEKIRLVMCSKEPTI